MGTQVVRINADLLHFQSIPSVWESSIEGVDWTGSKVAVHARAIIIMRKGRIAVIPLFDPGRLISGIDFILAARAEENGFVKSQLFHEVLGRRNPLTRSRSGDYPRLRLIGWRMGIVQVTLVGAVTINGMLTVYL